MWKGVVADNSVLYFQNFGGGGAALGLLAGPFGVMANMKMIETNTDHDLSKLKGRVQFNAKTAFAQASSAEGFRVLEHASAQDIRVTPYFIISKTTENTIHLSSSLQIEGGEGSNLWSRNYRYQLPGVYNLDSLATLQPEALANIQAQSTLAYAAILKQYNAESDASILAEPQIIYTSEFLYPRFTFDTLGSLIGEKEGRVWVRGFLGVVAIDPSNISYKKLAKN